MRGVLVAFVLCLAWPLAAQDALEPVRELYASADYEGALSAVKRLKVGADARTAIELDRYQVLCLVALGRTAEADAAIEGILLRDPQYDPAASDAPPRIRAAFRQVRQRVIPELVRQLYADGKAAFDRQAYPDAVRKLDETVKILRHPDLAEEADLEDLRTLARGFLDLSRNAMAESSSPALAPATALPPGPAARPAAPAASTPTATAPPTEPVVLRQNLPVWPPALARGFFNAEFSGAIEVQIDERGQVAVARIVTPIHPMYDPLLLEAARDWKYEPARRNGVPVKILKRVDIVLRPK